MPQMVTWTPTRRLAMSTPLAALVVDTGVMQSAYR